MENVGNPNKIVVDWTKIRKVNNNVNSIVTLATPKYSVQDDGIYVPHESGTSRLILPKEIFIEAYNKYIKGEE